MCQAAKKYLCGGFLGNFEDKHTSPPTSDDEDGAEADTEADKYMPKDHKKAQRSVGAGFGLVRKLAKRSDKSMLGLGWSPFLDLIDIEVHSGQDTVIQRLPVIIASRETITPSMFSSIHAEGRGDNLHTLELTHCKLKQFPFIGSLHGLKVCKLSHNDIFVVKQSNFSEGMQMEWLVLDYNRLEAVEPRALSYEFLPHLKAMNLSHNKLAFLPQDFCLNLEHLRYIDLSYNKLQKLPDPVCDCDNLQLVFLQSNELSWLPVGLERLHRLRKLFVSYNHLTQLPEGIGKCNHLEKLLLSSNRLSMMPDGILRLWKRQGGCLEELRLDGNPLVQPGLSAFEKGQLDIGFELLEEWIEEQHAERERQEALRKTNRLSSTAGSSDTGLALMDTLDPSKVTENIPRAFGSESSVFIDDRYVTEESPAASGPLSKVYASEGADSFAAAKHELEDGIESAEGRGVSIRRSVEAKSEDDYFFQHLADARGSLDKQKVAELRSAESSMLLMKKVRYIENRKALAKQKKEDANAMKKDFPAHLQKFLDPNLNVATYRGKVPVTSLDLHFCLLVYATMPMEENCAKLFDRFKSQQDRDYMKRPDWEGLCMHVKMKVPKEVEQELWDILSRGKDYIKQVDFIAAWHIHCLEDHDTWIRRASRVLRLNYYSMDVEELRERIQAKTTFEAEDKRGEVVKSSSESEGSSSSKSDNEVVHHEVVDVPLVEGERRRADVAGRRSGPKRAALPAVPEKPEGSPGLKTVGGRSPREPLEGQVSLTEEQQYNLSRRQRDDDSCQDSASTGESFPSEELSITDSSVSSFDARSVLGHLEEEEEAIANERLNSTKGQKMEIKNDKDIQKLMDLSPQEIFAAAPPPQPKRRPQHTAFHLAPKPRKLPNKTTQRDSNFRTDVFTVRLALREAQRNMTTDNFSSLVNFLLRSLKHLEHATTSLDSYWHIDDPNFRHATGIDAINPYVKQLLEQMGFVCLRGRYWVWPAKHLSMSDTGSWGQREVKPGCPGCEPNRLDDMVELFSRCQKSRRHTHHE